LLHGCKMEFRNHGSNNQAYERQWPKRDSSLIESGSIAFLVHQYLQLSFFQIS